MDIELFKEFVMLAKYLNFRETSERLNLSQPTLSRHISQLEADLQVQLFERDKQSVRLTNIGEVFLPEAKNLLSSFDQAMTRISDFRKGATGMVTVGFKQVYGVREWGQALGAFKKCYPEIVLETRQLFNYSEVIDELFGNKIDVAMMMMSEEMIPPDFHAIKLAAVPLCAAVNGESYLAEYTELHCADLSGNELVFPHISNASSMLATMKKFLRSRGMINCQTRYSKCFEESLMHVNLNKHIAIVPKCYFPYTSGQFFGARVFELADSEDVFYLYVLARKNNQNPATELFMSTCRDIVNRR